MDGSSCPGVPLARCPAFEGIGQVFQFIDHCANEMNGPLSKSYSPADRREGVPRSAPRMGRCSGQLVAGGWVITLESRRSPFACLLAGFRDICAKQKLNRLRTGRESRRESEALTKTRLERVSQVPAILTLGISPRPTCAQKVFSLSFS
jgi:hypothetical protein